MSVRSRLAEQSKLDQHLDRGIKANNENLLALKTQMAKLNKRIEKIEARRWWWPF